MTRQLQQRPTDVPLTWALEEEADDFRAQLDRYQKGELDADQFRAYRLRFGIYGQRQAGQFMARVKIPGGLATSEQVEVLADVADRYSRGIAEITTRQDVQFHHLSLEQVPDLLRDLASAGLTTREACGNVVRNVTVCHLAGICPREAFDVTGPGTAFASHFLRNPLTQQLPRKFKVGFSGCAKDCNMTAINDLGFVAVERSQNGAAQRGFRVLVGGGLGTIPRVARVLEEFIPEEELIPLSEAVLRAFDRMGNRHDRNRARIKFLVDKLGIDEFRSLVRQERQQVSAAAPVPTPDPAVEPLASAAPPWWKLEPPPEGAVDYRKWVSANVVPQRQRGFFAIHVLAPFSEVTSAQLRALAALAREVSGGRLRTTIQQNFLLPWVTGDRLPQAYEALTQAGLATLGAGGILDVTCCPGATTCPSAITTSRELARQLTKALERMDGGPPSADGISIKLSGCPNSCGQHQVASIGLYGCALHAADGRLYPAYQLLLGGEISERGSRLAVPVARLAAKDIPQVVITVVTAYRQHRTGGDTFAEFFDRWGVERLRELLAPYEKNVPLVSEQPAWYMDWGTARFFSLEERGEGECAV